MATDSMVGWSDTVIVTLIAIGSSVLVGVLGYLIEKSSDESGEPRHEAKEKGA
jgi:membrane protein YqaA with SNARE-associated domain